MTIPAEAVESVKFIGSVLGTFTALLAFLVRYEQKNKTEDRANGPKKADYDMAIEAYKSDPAVCGLFEDIKKIEVIKKNTGIHVTPDEIGALIGFNKKGRVNLNVVRRAWAYRKIKRDQAGHPVDLEFPLSASDSLIFWFGTAYFWVVFLMLVFVLFMNVYFNFTLQLPLLAIFLFLVLYMIGFVMLDAQMAARYIQTKVNE